MDRLKHITNHLLAANNTSYNNDNKKIALIGSGLIGRNWAVLFSRAGYNVCMYDISEQQLQNAEKDLKEFRLPLLNKFKMLFGNDEESVFKRISFTTNLESALKNVILVQEGIPENIALKQKVFKNIADTLYKINGPNCSTIISSSASTIIPSKLIMKMNVLKENLIVSHPVNPPMAIPVVEICPSSNTNKDIINRTKEIMESIGLKPCMMKKEVEGFIVNRLQYALLQAAYQLVSDGVVSPIDIDKTVKYGLGLRWSFMGPFETIHLNAPKGVNDYCHRYVESCIHPVLAQMFGTSFEKWTPEIWNKIHKNMEETVCKADKIGNRCAWRDNRLLNLANHKSDQDLKDSKKHSL